MIGIVSGIGGNRFDDNFDRFQLNKRKGDYDDYRGLKRINYGMKMIFFLIINLVLV